MNHFHNIGDWAFFEFRLVQIKEMKGPMIQEVNDGVFSTSGHYLNDRAVLLTMRNKIISEVFETAYKKIQDFDFPVLNYPDIYNYLIDLWVETCSLPPAPPKEEELQKKYATLHQFEEDIISASKEKKQTIINGIKLFRKKYGDDQ